MTEAAACFIQIGYTGGQGTSIATGSVIDRIRARSSHSLVVGGNRGTLVPEVYEGGFCPSR